MNLTLVGNTSFISRMCSSMIQDSIIAKIAETFFCSIDCLYNITIGVSFFLFMSSQVSLVFSCTFTFTLLIRKGGNHRADKLY